MSDHEQIEEFTNAVLGHEQPTAKPKRARTAKQLEAARRNMELGRQRRLENLAKKRAEKEAQKVGNNMARSNVSQLMDNQDSDNSESDQENSSEEEYEELIYEPLSIQPQPKITQMPMVKPKARKQKGGSDAELMAKLMADISSIKEYMTVEKVNKPNNTIIKVQVPPAQAQPTEPAEAAQQRKKILMRFGNR